MSRYRTLVLDPPWEYDRVTGLGGKRAAADNYPTMTNAEIAALPVRSLSESSGAHLYLWVTNPRLFREDDDGLGPRDMMAVWGFRYVTMLTWHKLTAEDVLEIRAIRNAYSLSELATAYGVSRRTIHMAATGQSWRHLDAA